MSRVTYTWCMFHSLSSSRSTFKRTLSVTGECSRRLAIAIRNQPTAISSKERCYSRKADSNDLAARSPNKAYTPSPSPPPLPPKEQKEFISLINKSNSSSPSSKDQAESQNHPDLRNLGPAEFEGDVNPKTGEVNGPKRDPLKWPNEWGYGGRATDF